MEYLSELEKKVDVIIKNLEQLRQENVKLKKDALQKADELDQIRSATQEHQDKLLAATDKIKGLIAKIDAA